MYSFNSRQIENKQNYDLPNGDQVETIRWLLAGLISSSFLLILGLYFLAIVTFLTLRFLGPKYEYHLAWFIDNLFNLEVSKKVRKQIFTDRTMNTRMMYKRQQQKRAL
ncbi:hypothetical protein ACFSCX_12625 [Bacillus salitolerans]|uniref:Conjugal transfer protein n=1 Tax=Bacillus salitolerans TaxID=1437434 RepID=A0ABW4LQF3_9BACI